MQNNTNRLLAVVVVLQGLLLLGQWTGGVSLFERPAQAQVNIPDPGARQLQMIEELKGVNSRMDRMLALMQSGEMKVKTVAADEKK